MLRERAESTRRVAEWRERRGEVRNGVGNAVTNAVSNPLGNSAPVPTPVPTPVPDPAPKPARRRAPPAGGPLSPAEPPAHRVIFGALQDALEYEPASRRERAAWGGAVSQLLTTTPPVTPTELVDLIHAYRAKFGDAIVCTPMALASKVGLLRKLARSDAVSSPTVKVTSNGRASTYDRNTANLDAVFGPDGGLT